MGRIRSVAAALGQRIFRAVDRLFLLFEFMGVSAVGLLAGNGCEDRFPVVVGHVGRSDFTSAIFRKA